jgi:hypothetical protein
MRDFDQAHVRFGSIVLQKSPQRSCRIKIRNNRIGENGSLNLEGSVRSCSKNGPGARVMSATS